MVKNSCCEKLYEKCANNTNEVAIIKEARNALVHFYTSFTKTILLNYQNPDENERKKAYNNERPAFLAAQEGVKKLNKLCANKKIEYVFKGKPDDTNAVYKFAKEITEEILNDMAENIPNVANQIKQS